MSAIDKTPVGEPRVLSPGHRAQLGFGKQPEGGQTDRKKLVKCTYQYVG
jgi:hypothetical protein